MPGETLLSRADSTDDGPRDGLTPCRRLSGKLARRSFRPNGQVAEVGNPHSGPAASPRDTRTHEAFTLHPSRVVGGAQSADCGMGLNG